MINILLRRAGRNGDRMLCPPNTPQEKLPISETASQGNVIVGEGKRGHIMNGEDMVPAASYHGHNERRGMHHIGAPPSCDDWQQALLKQKPDRPGPKTERNNSKVAWQQSAKPVTVFPIHIDSVLVRLIDFPQMKNQLDHVPVDSCFVRQQSRQVECESSDSIKDRCQSFITRDGNRIPQ